MSTVGADQKEAERVAEVLVWADCRGRSPQGSIWTQVFCDRLRAGSLRSPAMAPPIDRTSDVVCHLDANHGFGHVATSEATTAVIDTARRRGMGLATVRNSTHYGAAGFYAWRIAEAGMIGLSATNALAKVAAPGGTRPVLGTNPIAFAVPVDDGPAIVGDLSTGALAGSRVRDAVDRDESLPDGQLLDAQGRPTNDPRDLAAGGVMLPMAGGKGFALGLLVELLTAGLADGALGVDVVSAFDLEAMPNTSHLVMAIDVDADFARRARALAEMVLANAGGEVRIPGWSAAASYERRRVDGIDLPDPTIAALLATAADTGVPVPPWLAQSRQSREAS